MGRSRSIPIKFTVDTKLGDAAKSSEAKAATWHNWEMHISNVMHTSNLERRKTFSSDARGCNKVTVTGNSNSHMSLQYQVSPKRCKRMFDLLDEVGKHSSVSEYTAYVPYGRLNLFPLETSFSRIMKGYGGKSEHSNKEWFWNGRIGSWWKIKIGIVLLKGKGAGVSLQMNNIC